MAWFNESQRHKLATQRIKSGVKQTASFMHDLWHHGVSEPEFKARINQITAPITIRADAVQESINRAIQNGYLETKVTGGKVYYFLTDKGKKAIVKGKEMLNEAESEFGKIIKE